MVLTILLFITLLLCALYGAALLACLKSWRNTSSLIPQAQLLDLKFSIIVVVRDEQDTIIDCLTSIYNNTYPKNCYEVILVDDHSDDRTIDYVNHHNFENLKVIHLRDYDTSRYKEAYKKAGLAIGILQSKFPYILTTDGDCVVPKEWIRSYSDYFNSDDFNLVTGMIKIEARGTLLDHYQSIDMAATMVATAAGISSNLFFSANGGNMAFLKSAYEGYAKEMDVSLASGDDMMMILWVVKNQGKVGFLKNQAAIVETISERSLGAFINQRIRWGTKTTKYPSPRLTLFMALFYVFNLWIVMQIILGFIVWPGFHVLALIQFFVKLLFDVFVLMNILPFFNNSARVYRLVQFSFLHTIYIVLLGTLSLFVSDYKWKGRKVS